MKKKKSMKHRILAGLLAGLTMMTTVLSSGMVYAAELPEVEIEPPAYEQVKDQLTEDEVVIAKDYEIDFGSTFDLEHDFTNLEIKEEAVKVTMHESKNEQGEDFTTEKADTYKTVYYVEPISGNPTYQISRNLIVKQPVTEVQVQSETVATDHGESEMSESSDEEADSISLEEASTEIPTDVQVEEISEGEVTEDFTVDEVPEGEVLTEEEFNEVMEEYETQDTFDEESGLYLSDVLLQAEDAGIELESMEEGEEAVFFATSPKLRAASTTQSVSITRGSWYYYSDYGLGSYLTAPYYVTYGSISATAYCVQPSKVGPDDGTYTITKLSDAKNLAKVCYYGTKAAGSEGFFEEKHPDFPAGKRFIITHIAAAYANGSSDAFSGTNATGQQLAMELYNYCVNMPDIPSVAMSFSDANVTAYVDGNRQRTKEITFKADALQTITFKLPDGVKLHNTTTGKTSAAGANVEISGGTKFYLSAPLTQASDVKQTFSTTMKGSITKEYSAYKLITGGSTQDLAFVFGEGVTDEKYVDFSVKWVELATVSIEKKDATTGENLAGAIYGIYADEACTKKIMDLPATDKNGAASATFVKTQETVFIREITAPTGYKFNAKAYNVKLVAFQTTDSVVTDEEQLGSLSVYKVGEVLTTADVSESGVTFRYEEKKLADAKYNVYAAADITTPSGNLIHKKGALVAENLTTNESGVVTLNNLHLGSYRIQEVKAPENYVNHGQEQTVTLKYAGQNVDTVFADATFRNNRQKASVSLVKKDDVTLNPLDGGVYGLYAASDITNHAGKVVVTKGTFIEAVTTGEDGCASYHADLPIGFSYEIREMKAPAGYVRSSSNVYTFKFGYEGETKSTVEFTHTFVNERISAIIDLTKADVETTTAQGDATLAGAIYGLYAREDIIHPDGATGVIYKAGDKVAELTTNEEGFASVDDLYLGKYYVKEIQASEGYLLDTAEHDLVCSADNDLAASIVVKCNVTEQVKKQPFQIIKAANNGQTDAPLLAGAGFTAYLKSSLTVKEDGTYDFAKATPVVIGENGATEIFTDEKGHAVTIPIPYGTYVVRETTTPHNYKPVDDFEVRITENSTKPQVWRVMLDEEFKAKLKIVKKDADSKRTVLAAGTEFKVFNLDTGKYVEQVTTYPTVVKHKSYFTDSDGYLILPQNLGIGRYRIEEVTAPYGYTVNQNYVEVAVDTDTMYQIDSVSGDAMIEVIYENTPVKAKLYIEKQGEVLAGYEKDFVYDMANLADAKFEVYAAETIYTPDYQKDEAGNRLVIYHKDEFVTSVTTDETGKAVAENLPLGQYYVKEKTAPKGFTINVDSQEILFAYKDQNTAVVEGELSFTNDRQKVAVKAIKKDAENEALLAGAEFGLYVRNDIMAGDKVIVKADTLLATAVTGENGEALFALDLPLNIDVYVKEVKAPLGYVSQDTEVDLHIEYQGQDKAVAEYVAEFKNDVTKTEFTKSDLTTGVELDGATLTVLDKAGNVIESWTSVKGEPHMIKRLHVGETYILREEFAPYGYLKAEEVEFTIEDTGAIQKVEMKDAVPTGLLIINKKGEFLDKVSVLDNAKGTLEHLFEYITGNLENVTFEIYAAEDIKAADGVSEDYYKKDELVGTITTNATGIAQKGDLPVGKYYVKEVETAHGYVLDGEIRYIDLSYRDQDTPVVTFDEDWQNARQKVKVNVLKKDKNEDRVLKGGIFGLYTRNEIKNAKGDVLMEADTLIELKSTDENGQITFIADLPVDGKYYVKELYAPDGFVTDNEEQEFVFEYAGQEEAEVSFDFIFENEATTVEITKSDLTNGEEIPGAHLKVTDPEGNVVDEWVSTEEAHVIKELVVGKTYTLTETLPADGYVTAESIEFTIENTADVQKVEMKDDVTKVQISKTDITGTQEIPGAVITILDENDQVVEKWTSGNEPHYIEKLPIGKYTLREESAPKGYLVTEDVAFEVTDTAEIQKVEMKDDTAKGKVIINKTDKESGKPLKGVEFELRDSEGKVLETLVTDAAGHAESKLYEIASYKNGEYQEALKYYLVETKALDGYKLDETKHEITFEYVDDHTPVIEVTMDLENEEVPVTTPGTPSDSPKTGDATPIMMWMMALLTSFVGLVAVVIRIRKKK